MHHRLYVHVAWTTRDRERLIDAPAARFLVRYLRAIARQERAHILELGIVQTHVHLLARLHPTTAIPRLLQRWKGGSSAIAAKEGHTAGRRLRWERGYHIDSVSRRALDAVARYVREQPGHHPDEAIPDWEPPDVRQLDAVELAQEVAVDEIADADDHRRFTRQSAEPRL